MSGKDGKAPSDKGQKALTTGPSVQPSVRTDVTLPSSDHEEVADHVVDWVANLEMNPEEAAKVHERDARIRKLQAKTQKYKLLEQARRVEEANWKRAFAHPEDEGVLAKGDLLLTGLTKADETASQGSFDNYVKGAVRLEQTSIKAMPPAK